MTKPIALKLAYSNLEFKNFSRCKGKMAENGMGKGIITVFQLIMLAATQITTIQNNCSLVKQYPENMVSCKFVYLVHL